MSTRSFRVPHPAPQGDSALAAVIVISDLEFGGAQRQVIELANRLPAQGVNAYVCSLSPYVPLGANLERPETLHVIPRRFRFDFTVVPRLTRFVKRVKADIIHSFLFDAEIAGRLAGVVSRRTVVIGSERNTDYQIRPRDRRALQWTRSLQDLVIANSKAGAEFNSALIGLPRTRYRVVRNGVDVERFRQRTAPDRLGIPPDHLVVGMFASFKPQKNHELLLKVIRDIRHSVERVRFLFVGDSLYKGMSDSDSYKAGLRRRVDELGIRDLCVFAGNRTDVEHMYSICDLTVLPSAFEGTPNVLLESMACGVPVVATDVSDNRDIVLDGEVGFLVPRGDALQMKDRLIELLMNESLRRMMSQRAREWAVGQFSTSKLALNTAAVYREAIAARRGQ